MRHMSRLQRQAVQATMQAAKQTPTITVQTAQLVQRQRAKQTDGKHLQLMKQQLMQLAQLASQLWLQRLQLPVQQQPPWSRRQAQDER